MIDHEDAARRLTEAYRTGAVLDRLPLACRPSTIEDAYRIQDRVAAALGAIGGWKVGLSPADGAITCAPVPAACLHDSGAVLEAASYHGLAVEMEFAFRLARDLPPRDDPYGHDEVAAAIEGFCPLIEILASRFQARGTLGMPEQLADAGGTGGFVLGETIRDWRALDFAAQEVLLRIDGTIRQSAIGTHPAGDPVTLVVWLANHAIGRCGGLKAGDIVTTGSLDGASAIAAGSGAEADYGPWGRVSVAFR